MAHDERAINKALRGLSEKTVNNIVSFLRILTGKSAKTEILGIPETVPTALTIDHVSEDTTN